MDSYKLHAREKVEQYKEKADEYKDALVYKAGDLVDDVRGRSIKAGSTVRDKVTHPLDTIDEARGGFDSVFNAEKFDRAKDKIETEASIVLGYKDQFLGAIKEAFGRMLKDEELKAAGHQQRIKGQNEVKLQKALEEEKKFQKLRAQIVEVLMRREALLSQLVRSFGSQQLRHVEVRERSPADLFVAAGAGRTTFKLKQYNVQSLLRDIREKRTMKPMVFVDVRERGLIRSIPLTKKDVKGWKGRNDRYVDLWAAIRRSDVQKLHSVSSSLINDRSAPRLDILRNLAAADQRREELLKDVVSPRARSQLVHVADNGAGVQPPSMSNKTAGKSKGGKAKLLDELRQTDVDLKHVETLDKSQPAIGKDVQLKTWDKKGFLDEVRQGTELKHI
jgi:uncharacterized protein YjbJ (UPF0337 family)